MIFHLPDSMRNGGSHNIGFAAAYHQGLVIGGKAIVGFKNGFLSCLRSISNSVENLMRPLFRPSTKYNISNHVASSHEAELSLPGGAWSIKKIPAIRIAQVCQTVISAMEKRENVNDMFRISLPAGRAEQLNSELQQDPAFASQIERGDIQPYEVSVLVKLWCDQIMADRQFTLTEAQSLIENKSDKEYLKQSLVNKLAPLDAQTGETWDKLKSIFSLFNAYRDVCRIDGANEKGSVLKYNEDALLICVSPRFFDITDGGKATLADGNNNVTLSKTAFLPLLDAFN
ncbi:hypothetical protein [Vagococcus sp. WN89Y]|uniref:hypothetical protein n=1 Tax=Vagococcus sp. WN89Y TaxID=3457258 RepID=UPI003FCCAF26